MAFLSNSPDDFGITSDEDDTETDPSFEPTPAKKAKNDIQVLGKDDIDRLVAETSLGQLAAERLVRALKNRGFTTSDVKSTSQRVRAAKFRDELKMVGKDTAVLNDIDGYLRRHNRVTDHSKYNLFLDGATSGNAGKHLIACLLPIRSSADEPKKSVVPLLYSTSMGETYEDVKTVLNLINYSKFKWKVICDFKLVQIMAGLKSGFCSFPCLYCLWNSRLCVINDAIQIDWLSRSNFAVNPALSQIRQPLIPIDRFVMPSLHIKLGIFQQFVKSLSDRINPENKSEILKGNPKAIQFLSGMFKSKTLTKVKSGAFTGPEIDKVIRRRADFSQTLSRQENACFTAIINLVNQFFSNHKSPHFKNLVNNLKVAFSNSKIRMSTKVHYLLAHLDKFPENLGFCSEQSGERFHKEIKAFKVRYKGNPIGMLADFLWTRSIKDQLS